MKAVYRILNNGYKVLTKYGEEMWTRFTEVYKDVIDTPIFEGCDVGEIADIFAKEFPRLDKYDIYNYVLFDGER